MCDYRTLSWTSRTNNYIILQQQFIGECLFRLPTTTWLSVEGIHFNARSNKTTWAEGDDFWRRHALDAALSKPQFEAESIHTVQVVPEEPFVPDKAKCLVQPECWLVGDLSLQYHFICIVGCHCSHG